MDTLLGNIFFHFIGRLFLFFRYRNKEKRKTALTEKYFDSYSAAGSAIILKPFAFICFLLMLGFIAIVIYSAIVHGIQ